MMTVLALIFSLISLICFLFVIFVLLTEKGDLNLSDWDDMDPIKLEPWLFDKHDRIDYE